MAQTLGKFDQINALQAFGSVDTGGQHVYSVQVGGGDGGKFGKFPPQKKI